MMHAILLSEKNFQGVAYTIQEVVASAEVKPITGILLLLNISYNISDWHQPVGMFKPLSRPTLLCSIQRRRLPLNENSPP
jgi:hypothetical protein